MHLVFSSMMGCSFTIRAKTHHDSRKSIMHFQTFDFERSLNFTEFKSLLFSDEKGKYDKLIHEIEQTEGMPVEKSALLRNCKDLFREIKYQNMVKVGVANDQGQTYIEQNKSMAREWDTQSFYR